MRIDYEERAVYYLGIAETRQVDLLSADPLQKNQANNVVGPDGMSHQEMRDVCLRIAQVYATLATIPKDERDNDLVDPG